MNNHDIGAGSPATLRDVARVAGVHPGTASRAINPDTRRLVNEDTTRRVIDAAEALGYRPNSMARGLKTNRSFTIGVLIPDLTNPLFPPIVRGIQDTLERAGYTPFSTNTDNDPQRARMAVAALRARRVDGIIAATARRDHEHLDELVTAGIPVVLVNRSLADGRFATARVNDREGIGLAVEHLVSLGHRRIAHVGAPRTLSTGALRYEGFVAALRKCGLNVDPGLVDFGEAFTTSEGVRLCAELLARTRDFTAIVAANDLMALGCYDAVAAQGLSCPGDISVVGFNDMPFVDRFDPPLTTIRIPHYELGTATAELLLERLRDPGLAPREVLLPPELVVRGSSAPVSA